MSWSTGTQERYQVIRESVMRMKSRALHVTRYLKLLEVNVVKVLSNVTKALDDGNASVRLGDETVVPSDVAHVVGRRRSPHRRKRGAA